MLVSIYKSDQTIQFHISVDVTDSLRAWERHYDEIVFNEQVETGMFFDNVELNSDTWNTLKHIKEQGEIAPYYGAIGGACSYSLQILGATCSIGIEHSVMKERMNIESPLMLINDPLLDKKRTPGFTRAPQ